MVHPATEEDKANKPDQESKINLALHKTVTATAHEGAYVAANAVDGDAETRWGSLPSGEGWLEVDLESVRSVSGMEIYLESAWVPYRIEYSVDGETYETLRTCQKDELIVLLENLDIEARYIRLTRDGSNWFSVYEVIVYGE